MANAASRANIAFHYATMVVLVGWTIGLGVFVFYGLSPLEESGDVASRPHVSTQQPLPM